MVELSPRSIADLRQLGAAYRGGEKDIRKAIRDGLTAAGKPLAAEVVREGAAVMPRRGGLAARIAGSRGAVSGSFTARGASVSIRITDKAKDALGAMDNGSLRHPTFGRGPWVAQTIQSGAFTRAFNKGAPEARDRVERAIQDVLADIARRA